MTKKFLTLLMVTLSLFSIAQSYGNRGDKISIPGPIDFNGTEFFLDWVNQPSKTLYVQQYLPKDEVYKEFTQLISISYFDKEIDLELAAKQKVEQINNRKEDKYASVNVTESPDGKEYIVDFITTETPEKGRSFAEYNFYRFKKIEKGEQKSLVIFDYAQRIYGDIKYASKAFQKNRKYILDAVIQYQIPEITLVENQISKSKPAEAKPEVKQTETKTPTETSKKSTPKKSVQPTKTKK